MGKRRHKKARGKKVDRRGRRRHPEQQKADKDKRKTTGQNRTQITKQKSNKGVKQMGIWGVKEDADKKSKSHIIEDNKTRELKRHTVGDTPQEVKP